MGQVFLLVVFLIASQTSQIGFPFWVCFAAR